MKKTTQILSAAAILAIGASSLVACVSAGDGKPASAAAASGASDAAAGVSLGTDGAAISAPGASVSGGADGGKAQASDAGVSGGTDGATVGADTTTPVTQTPERTKDTTAPATSKSSQSPTSTQTDQSWWTDPANGMDGIPDGWPSGLPAAGGWEVFSEETETCEYGVATFSTDGRSEKLLKQCGAVEVKGTGMIVVLTKPVDSITVTGSGNQIAVASVKTVTISGEGNRVAYDGAKPAILDRGRGNVVSKEPLAAPGGVG